MLKIPMMPPVQQAKDPAAQAYGTKTAQREENALFASMLEESKTIEMPEKSSKQTEEKSEMPAIGEKDEKDVFAEKAENASCFLVFLPALQSAPLASFFEGVDDKIIPILDHLLDEEFTVESIYLARMINQNMASKIGNRSRNRGLKEESWFVVRNAKMPSVLIEMGFITNREEALLMQDAAYLKDMAQGIYNGINSFIQEFESTKGFTE